MNTFNCWSDAYKVLRAEGFVRIGQPYTRNDNSETWFNVEKGFAEVKAKNSKVVYILHYSADAYYKVLNK